MRISKLPAYKYLIVLVFVPFLLSGCGLLKRKTVEDEPRAPITLNEPVNVISVAERPYLRLTPTADGKRLVVQIDTLPLPAKLGLYEIEYQAGTLLRGVSGSIDLEEATLPVSSTVDMGTCSTGGTCSYDKGVTGGTLEVQFSADPNFAVRTDWRYLEGATAKGLFASRDTKFQMNAGKLLDKTAYVIISETSGLPGPVDKTLASDPYGVFASSTLPSGEVEVSIRVDASLANASILSWDGSAWQTHTAIVKDSKASATVPLAVSYVVVE